MTATDFLEYFLVKERLADLSYQENLSLAKSGNEDDQLVSDVYFARKLIFQRCKSVSSRDELFELLDYLNDHVHIPEGIFNKEEFTRAWQMTIKDIRSQFS